ncbi:MAG: biopolymer transporter ExbD [Planctomycetes bacterium]|nr:biopolymer transporter ExbD [Planctomycetota bacterium]
MKVRGSGKKAEKVDVPMAPMIDVVFQLLIFFMLTLNIVAPEGDFNINMPIGAPGPPSDNVPTSIQVRLLADPETGQLAQLQVTGQEPYGSGPAAFQRLNTYILQQTGAGKNPLADEIEVEIDPDYEVNYEYIVKAISSVTGRMRDGKLQRFVEKIKFAAPREARGRVAG